jgi:GxxExxY protein
LHAALTGRVIGAAQKVHGVLGPGFPEGVHHRALCRELELERIPFESEKAYEVAYEQTVCGQFRVDVVVEGIVAVELKALSALTNDHLAQALSYLKAAHLRVALLLNFGRKSLEVKRVSL